MGPTQEAEEAVNEAVRAINEFEGEQAAQRLMYAQIRALAAIATAVDRLAASAERREP